MTTPPHRREGSLALLGAIAAELRMVRALTGLDEQFHRRLIVRVFFSAFEAFAFHLKQRSLATGKLDGRTFTKSQIEKLTELRRKVKPDGSEEVHRSFLRSQDNLAFALDIYREVMKVPAAPPVPATEMTIGVDVRDRLTHPKTATAFVMTDEEAEALVRLGQWFKTAVRWFGDSEQAFIARIGEELDALESAIERRKADQPKA